MTASQTREDTSRKVRAFVEGRFPLVVAEGLSDEDSLIESGAIDSLGLLDVVEYLESEFGISIGDEDIAPETFGSIAALTALVNAKQG